MNIKKDVQSLITPNGLVCVNENIESKKTTEISTIFDMKDTAIIFKWRRVGIYKTLF
jgi:hypothetical protein